MYVYFARDGSAACAIILTTVMINCIAKHYEKVSYGIR